MNSSNSNNITLRPFSSQKGFKSLITCALISLLFAVITLFVSVIAPDAERKANIMVMAFGIVSILMIALGIILYFIFPRVTIIFDAAHQTAIIKTAANTESVIPFNSLQPFQIYERYFGYAPQYYCRNASFGKFSDLYSSTFHRKTLKMAQKLAALTCAPLFDCEGKRVIINK
jgi:hypothetical protein